MRLQRLDRDGTAIKRDELHVERPALRMNVNDRADILSLEAERRQALRQHDAVVFADIHTAAIAVHKSKTL